MPRGSGSRGSRGSGSRGGNWGHRGGRGNWGRRGWVNYPYPINAWNYGSWGNYGDFPIFPGPYLYNYEYDNLYDGDDGIVNVEYQFNRITPNLNESLGNKRIDIGQNNGLKGPVGPGPVVVNKWYEDPKILGLIGLSVLILIIVLYFLLKK